MLNIDIASQLIEEAVVHSIRHGKSSEVKIVGNRTASEIEVSVSAIGRSSILALRGGHGIVLFNTFAQSWFLSQEVGRKMLKFILSKDDNR